MRSVGQGEDDEDEARNNGGDSPPVHPDERILVAEVLWDEEVARHDEHEAKDGANPKVPSPGEEFGRDGAQEDAQVETDAGKRPVEAKDDVLPRTGAVGPRQESETGRHEGARAEALHGAADDEHGGVLAEAADEGPDEEPDMAEEEDDAGAVAIRQSSEWQEETGGSEVDDAGGPCTRRLGDVEGGRHSREDDVEATDLPGLSQYGELSLRII